MSTGPCEITLRLRPAARLDLIDVTARVRAEARDFFERYRRTLYCSYHTTAGYFEQSLSARLGYRQESLRSFLAVFEQLFPPEADYEHDKMHLRRELSEGEKRTEPRNADSHLAFIGAGLKSCVTYANRAGAAVHFVDLDGVHEHGVRDRRTTVLGYDHEEPVDVLSIEVPVSAHAVEAVNLRDERAGLVERLGERIRALGIEHGRVDLALDPSEARSGLTVNEYETLLMRHDLAEVLAEPVRFMTAKARKLLRNPRRLLDRGRAYAGYDAVRVLNELLDKTGFSETVVERMIARAMAVPAQRFLRIQRAVSLPVSPRATDAGPGIVRGTYQSPVLVQWAAAPRGSRRLQATIVRFG